jgi:ribose transport system substrate-binding protein
MKHGPVVCLALALAAGVISPGCGGGSSKIKVGFVSNNAEEFWSIANAGATNAADKYGVELIFQRPSAGTAAEQKEIIDSMLARGVKAIAISVIDPKNQNEYLDEVAGKVSLICVDNDAPSTKRLCYIGTDNLAAGTTVGQLVKKAMPGGGKVALFVGQLSAVNAQQRWHGVLNGLAGHTDASGTTFGKYVLVGQGPEKAPFTDDVDTKRAKDNADDVLAQNQGEANLCLVGLWAYNPPAIYAAVKDKNLQGKVKMVGFDEMKDTLEGIEKGDIFATVVQDPYNFGYQSVKLMAALAKGDRSGLPRGGMMPIPHRVISRERISGVEHWMSVGDFRKDLDRKLGK